MSKVKGVIVFASNTDCGKTLASAGVIRAALSKKLACAYFKPVQTGVTQTAQSDASRIQTWTGLKETHTLLEYRDPVSPHLAAKRENRVVSSFELRERLAKGISILNNDNGFTVVETAGGVLSPFPDETLAADALQLSASKLELRTILVGDARLGGIAQTLAALEALEARRYDVCSLLVFSPDSQENDYANVDFLSRRLIMNPPVRRINTPIPTQGPIPKSFFDHPVFDQVLDDILDIDHDKRLM